ncbi:hypothetical protein QZH56_26205 [Streptomyces olivoreticuli]|uniref:hypothetical protein n=1 Tax=Streptomyces olivoreticuli TaxID=68246 RepID=UPI00265B7195|nr:hypothetical protein [Streptomyces olivoreticuli]WKK22263.1 hypothetical protein QZH56_26205 [Streptomyces olivoreticuli]
MADPEAEKRILRYAEDISLADVERLDSFLTARTARLAGAERGSDERQLARAVRQTTLHLVTTLRHSLSCSGPDNEAQSMLRLQLRVSWNALWALVSPWQWHDEYDQARWRPVKYWDASQIA